MKRQTAWPARLASSLPLLAFFLLPGAAVAPAAELAPQPLSAAAPAGGTTAGTAAAPTATQPAAPQHQDPAPLMTTYYVALLRRGPGWTPDITPEIKQLLDGHMANIRRLAATGKLLVAGPFLDQSGPGALAGLFVLQAGSLAEAKLLTDTDPAVHAGRFAVEVVPWLGPKSLQNLATALQVR